MTFESLLTQLGRDLAAEAQITSEAIGVTGYFNAILGTPEGIVVDDDSRRDGCMWVRIEGQTPFLAKNTSSELTFDNSAGGLNVEVRVGFPPGSSAGKDRPSILGLTDRGRQALGGLTVMQAGIGLGQNPQAERLVNLRLFKGTTALNVSMSGGWYNLGAGLHYALEADDIVDLTSHVPTNAGEARYVVVSWNGTDAVVDARPVFDTTGSYLKYEKMVGETTPGTIRLGVVLLEYGMTAWAAGQENHIIPNPQIYNGLAASKSTVDPTTADDTNAGYSYGWLWLNDTSDTLFICKDSTAGGALWQQVGGSGAGGNIFDAIYVQGSDYQHSLNSSGLTLSRQNSSAAAPPFQNFDRYRGTVAAPSNVAQNDYLSEIYARGYAGGGVRNAATRRVEVIETTPSATAMGAKVTELISDLGSVSPTAAFNWTAKRVALDIPLDIVSLSTAQRDALTPDNGWLIYNSTTNTFQFRQNAAWAELGSGSGGTNYAPLTFLGW